MSVGSLISSKLNLANTNQVLENVITKESKGGMSGSADDDLDGPSSRSDGFKVFSPGAIKSSLLRNPSLSKQQHSKPATYIHPNAIPAVNALDLMETDGKIEVLIMENDRLIQETLRQNAEIEALNFKLGQANKKAAQVTGDLENTTEQLESLREHLDETQDGKKLIERQLKFGNQEIATRDAEIDRLTESVQKKDREVESLSRKTEDMKKDLKAITTRYHDLVEDALAGTQREKLQSEELELQIEKMHALESKLIEQTKNLEAQKDELETQMAINKNLERKIGFTEKREIEFLEKEQKISQEIEEARYERDTALRREQLLLREIDVLNQKCLDQPKLYKEKNDLALQTLRSQFAVDKRRFVDETQKLEELCTSLQSQVERAMRDKRAAESELDKMTRHIPAEADRLTMAVEEMHSKLCASERERHEAVQKLESIQQKMIREVNQYENERHQANERIEESHRRIRRLEREVEDCKSEGITLQQTLSNLEQDKKSAHEQIRALTITHETQTKLLTSKYESQIADITAKLENVGEAHSSTQRDMQRLLATQGLLSEKWRDESDQIKHHYDQLISKLKLEMNQYQVRVGELENAIQKGATQRKVLIDQVTAEKKQYRQLHDACVQLKKESEAKSKDISELLSKEVEMVEDRKRLAREVDRLQLEKEERRKEGLKSTLRPRTRHIMKDLEDTEDANDQKMTEKLEHEIERVQKRSKTSVKKQVLAAHSQHKPFTLEDSD